MRPAVIVPGTKSPETPSDYTDAQWAAVQELLHTKPKLRFNAARKEYVNSVLLANGKISKDLAAVRDAAVKADADDKAAYHAFVKALEPEIALDDLSPELRKQYVNLKSEARHSITDELEDAIAQQRFLLVVDAARVPRIYFQCFTGVKGGKPLNPDLELA